QGTIDMLADTVAFANGEGGGNAEGKQHRANLIGETANERMGFAARAFALFVHDAAQSLRHMVVSTPLGPGAFAAPCRGRSINNIRPDLADVVVTEPKAIHDARAEVLDEDIDGWNERPDDLDRFGDLEVQGEALLAPVVAFEVG